MNTSDKSPLRTFVRLGLLAAALVAGAGVGCNGCRPKGSYPQQDAGAEYPIQRGSVGVAVDFADCPATPVVQASPSNGRVGEAVSLVTSTQVTDGGSINLKWTTSVDGGGSFSAAGASKTSFLCTSPGPVTLTVTVSNGRCSAVQDVSFYCLAARGGGLVDGGGDAAVPDAGTGGQGAGTGGQGAGTGGQGGGGGPIVNTCPQEPTSGPDGAKCAACVVGNCSLGNAGSDGCCGLADRKDQELCVKAFACFQAHASTCVDDEGKPDSCFCGTSGNACFSTVGAANGPCVGVVQDAAKTTVPAAIQGQFTSPASPLGRSVNLKACMGSFCPAECSYRGELTGASGAGGGVGGTVGGGAAGGGGPGGRVGGAGGGVQ